MGGGGVGQIGALCAQGRSEEAVTLANRLLAADPTDREASYQLGACQVARGEASLAVWPLRQAAQGEDALAGRAGVLLARALVQVGAFEEAIRTAGAVLAREPADAQALLLRAQAHAGLSQHGRAIADAARALELEPDSLAARSVHATSLAETDRHDEAEASLRVLHDLAEERAPASSSHTCAALAAFAHERRGDAELAAQRIATCLDDHPTSPLVLQWFAWLLGQRDPTRVDEALAQATELAPDDLALWRIRALWLEGTEREPEARTWLGEAAERIGSVEAWALLADRRRRAGDLPGALAALARGVAVSDEDDSLAYLRADLLAASGRSDEARAVGETLDRPEMRALISARILHETGELEAALEAYERGLALWPDNAAARYHAGVVAWELGRIEDALAHFREATRANSAGTDAALHMAELLYATGQYRAANELAVRHAIHRPMDGRLYQVGARAALMVGAVDDARYGFRVLVGERAGLEQEALLGLAAVERHVSGPAAAAEVFESAALELSDPESDRALAAWAQDLLDAGQEERALARIGEAIALQGETAPLLDTQGRILLASGSAEQAARAFARARVLDPAYGPALAGEATLLARAGRTAEAISGYDEARSGTPPDPEAGYLAAQLVLAAGDHAEAEHRLRYVLRARPGHARAANDLAWLLAEAGRDLDTALDLAQRASRVQPAAHTWDTLGAVYMARRDAEQAAEAYQRSLAEAPSPSVRYRLALAQLARGSPAAAHDSLRIALSEGPFPEGERAREQLASLEGELGQPAGGE